MLKIIADENMPLVQELFSPYGDVTLLPGREMMAEQVADADVLLVRSVTAVDEVLLSGSNIRFVGTATIGTDHIDEDYLQQQGVAFSSAPGCNANSVVQYVLSAFAVLRPNWQQCTVGIVGCGNVGGRLYHKLKALGVECRCYDPFLTVEQIADLITLDEVLACDLICLHTPLTTDGPYPTHHLFDEKHLSKIRPGTLLLNAGRGAVVDNQALLRLLPEKRWQVVLDVWESEPEISLGLLRCVAIATPHIAGYSYDGKINGTLMLRDAFCHWLGEDIPVKKQQASPSVVEVEDINEAILASYDIREDDQRMRQTLLTTGADIAREFDCLRKQYPRRMEFHHYSNGGTMGELLKRQLVLLGFAEGAC